MARTKALTVEQSTSEKLELKEAYAGVIQAVRKNTLSQAHKSRNYAGDPTAASLEFKRFVNSTAKEQGTARTAGKGDKIKADPITLNKNVHREIVEEARKFDVDTMGETVFARRADDHAQTMEYELDTAYFAAIAADATAFTPSAAADTYLKKLEEMFVELEKTTNIYVRGGIRRSEMICYLDSTEYSKIRSQLDTQANTNVNTAEEEFGMYHGVKIYSTVNMPSDAKVELIRIESVAQEANVYPYSEPTRIPQSNDMSSELFYDYGTKVLTPDLMLKMADLEVSAT